jgi:hypothetical protein
VAVIVFNHPGLNVRFAAVKSLFIKNLFRSKKQLQSHTRHWHNRTSKSSNLNDSPTYHTIEEVNGTQESAELDGTQEVYDNPTMDAFGTRFVYPIRKLLNSLSGASLPR